MPAVTILFCADPLNPAKPDPAFAAQVRAVREQGGQVAVVDHDALLAGQAASAVRRVPRGLGSTWYRGWMIPTSDYAALDTALANRGVRLQVTSERYRTAHELPGWYGTFTEMTPQSVWLPWAANTPIGPAQVEELIAPLGAGPAVVKDYVKSRKHEWDEACFIPELTEVRQAHRVIARMLELQEESLNGGIVVRRFEHFAQTGNRTAEARVWWVDGQPVTVNAHPDTPGEILEPDLSLVAPLVAQLGCRFITTDVALRTDGVWRVVEIGDAQVSDLPVGLDPAQILGRLP